MNQLTLNQDVMVLIILIISLSIALYFFFRYRAVKKSLSNCSRQHEIEMEEKSRELFKMVEELRAAQSRFLESGKMSALASLSPGILHQMSQPVTVIHGFTRFLKREMDPNDEFYKPICKIEEQSMHLKKMLENLIELVHHREVKKEDICVNDVLEKSMNFLTDELRIRRINWDLDLAKDVPLIFADGVHLQQVFMNIVANAIQALSALPSGSQRYLRVSSHCDEHEISISFKDSGPGIAPNDQKLIFEPFFSTKSKGAGVGLALCKNLVAEYGGSISVESQPAAGANFILKLPYVSGKS